MFGRIAIALALPIAAPTWGQASLATIKADYSRTLAELERHLVFDEWIDDNPESPVLLARLWTQAAEYAAAWLDAHPQAASADLSSAIGGMVPSQKIDAVKLADRAFLIVAPGPIGNVFIVAQSGDHYRLAWSTAQHQEATGKQNEILAAWQADHARHGHRGPYSAASGSAGPVIPKLGQLPSDGQGRSRFYIDGIYQQSAGATCGAQISVWRWDGTSARVLIAREYTVMIDQAVRTRIEGDLLKVQEKKSFRSFFSCGGCEERQTDWIVRLTPDGIEDVGEKIVAPQLDVIDELFYRLIHHKPASDIASQAAVLAASKMINESRHIDTAEDWKRFPTLGMMMGWAIEHRGNTEIVCLDLDWVGAHGFALSRAGSKFFVMGVKGERSCKK
jgi:hypothetical protein